MNWKTAVLSVLLAFVLFSSVSFAASRTNTTTRNSTVSAAIDSAAATVASAIPALPSSTPSSSAASSASGARATTATSQTAAALPATPCTETDGGLNFNKFGTTSGAYVDTGTYEKWLTDYCIGNSTLVERYCGQDGYVHDVEYKCQMGYKCDGGVCVATGGATCMGVGESCANYFCCYPLACKKHGSQFLCYNTTLETSSSAAKDQVYVQSAKELNATEYQIPEDEAGGTGYLKEMYGFSYGMDNETLPYYVEITLEPHPKTDSGWFLPEYSYTTGNVDGLSLFMQPLSILEFRFADGTHALAFFNTVNGIGKNTYARIHYISHDCDYTAYADLVSCSVGADPRDIYKLVGKV